MIAGSAALMASLERSWETGQKVHNDPLCRFGSASCGLEFLPRGVILCATFETADRLVGEHREVGAELLPALGGEGPTIS